MIRAVERPELLLFDLGGVLVDNVVFERLKAIPHIRMSEAEMKSKWLASSSVRAFELGTTSAADFATAFLREWDIPGEPDAFLADFATWPRGFYPGALDLLVRLRVDFRLACLSNSNSLHWGRISDVVAQFDVALSSHLLGAIKPDARCFDRAIDECRVARHRLAFFDDSLDNVVAARAVGIRAFHACGPEDVQRALIANGWLQWSRIE